jgi:hypothetical protein
MREDLSMSPYNEANLRLERMRELWRELQHTPLRSPRYKSLAKTLRAESDACQALVAAQDQQPNDSDD